MYISTTNTSDSAPLIIIEIISAKKNITKTSEPISFIHHHFGSNDPNEFEDQSKHCVNKKDGIHHQILQINFWTISCTHTREHISSILRLVATFFSPSLHIFDIDAHTDPDELVMALFPIAAHMFILSLHRIYEGWTMNNKSSMLAVAVAVVYDGCCCFLYVYIFVCRVQNQELLFQEIFYGSFFVLSIAYWRVNTNNILRIIRFTLILFNLTYEWNGNLRHCRRLP